MWMFRRDTSVDERGQIAVVAAGVVALMLLATVAVGVVGFAMIERTAATAAADAVALGDAVDPTAGASLGQWYADRGFQIQASDGRARARGDEAQAESMAVADRELRVAPVVWAIVARAEQLLGRSLVVDRAEDVTVTFAPGSARAFDAVAAELGMCAVSGDTYVRC